ncbi:MAG: OmpA family protein [Phycisphaerae bacterium]|nr:OmpA family protein [Phycisphaerae bacterium]
MRSRFWIVGAVVGAALVLTGCNNKQKDELAMMTDRQTQLQAELDQSKSALDSSEQTRRALEEENARIRAVADASGTGGGTSSNGNSDSLPTDLPPGVTAHVQGSSVVVDIPGDVLFDSGKATLRTDAKKTLDAVAKSIKAKYPGKRLSVEGFTDTDPIKKSSWADNYELAYERARAVGKFLAGRGFSESQFRYVSYGPTEPKSSKKASRRVELAIMDAMD